MWSITPVWPTPHVANTLRGPPTKWRRQGTDRSRRPAPRRYAPSPWQPGGQSLRPTMVAAKLRAAVPTHTPAPPADTRQPGGQWGGRERGWWVCQRDQAMPVARSSTGMRTTRCHKPPRRPTLSAARYGSTDTPPGATSRHHSNLAASGTGGSAGGGRPVWITNQTTQPHELRPGLAR